MQPAKKHHILHIAWGLGEETGGLGEYIPRLCALLVREGYAVTMTAVGNPAKDNAQRAEKEGVRVRTFPPSGLNRISYSRQMALGLPALAAQADIIHAHGLWRYPMWLGGRLARRLGKPLVITPHGCLEPQALKKSWLKKKLSAPFLDNPNLRQAACLHASSEKERDGFREYGLANPVAMISHAVDVPTYRKESMRARIESRFGACRGKRILLVVSRINPSKGLIYLARAWGEIAYAFPDWHLLIVGPDEDGHINSISKILDRNRASSGFTYAGPLYGEDRQAVFGAAELFVSPTKHESFGLTIAEALASGVPVITTQVAPWAGLRTRSCGWWIAPGKDPLVGTLSEALSLSTEKLEEMGRRGRAWIIQSFNTEYISKEMSSVYRWLLGEGNWPACVFLDE